MACISSLIFVFLDRVCSPGWPQIFYVAKDDLKFLIFLPLPPEWPDYGAEP